MASGLLFVRDVERWGGWWRPARGDDTTTAADVHDADAADGHDATRRVHTSGEVPSRERVAIGTWQRHPASPVPLASACLMYYQPFFTFAQRRLRDSRVSYFSLCCRTTAAANGIHATDAGWLRSRDAARNARRNATGDAAASAPWWHATASFWATGEKHLAP